MKVEDLTYLHRDLVLAAKAFGAEYPEDTVQDAWVKLTEIENKEGSLDRIENPKDFMFLTIKNQILNERRGGKKNVRLNPDEEQSEENYNEDIRYTDAMEEISNMSEKDRELIMAYINNPTATARSLAKEMRISKSFIHERLSKIRRKILKKVG